MYMIFQNYRYHIVYQTTKRAVEGMISGFFFTCNIKLKLISN